MSTLGERIKSVRLDAKQTQAVFSEKIGIKRNTLAMIESQDKATSEVVLKAICREYRVNKEWLEFEAGPKYQSDDDTLTAKVASALASCSDSKKELMRIILDMPDDLLDVFYKYMVQDKKN